MNGGRLMKMTRQEQKEMTRKIILDSAVQVFSDKGFENATTFEIAKMAGISHGSIFSHFESKDVLIQNVIEKFGHEFKMTLHNELEDYISVEKFLIKYIGCIEKYEKIYKNIMLEKCRNDILNIEFSELQYTISIHFFQKMKSDFSIVEEQQYSFYFNLWMGIITQYLINSECFVSSTESVLAEHGEYIVKEFINVVKIFK